MKIIRCLFVVLVIAGATNAQDRRSQFDIGISAAGDRDRGYKQTAIGLTGRCVLQLGSIAIDASADWNFHAPKIAPIVDGKTIATNVLVRRYFGRIYAVGGVDLNQLSTVILDATATSAVTGVGFEAGNVRLQGIYEPPDFSSGQSLSHYKLEAEYTKRFSNSRYVSFRWKGTVARFDRSNGIGILMAERVGMTVSFGRLF